MRSAKEPSEKLKRLVKFLKRINIDIRLNYLYITDQKRPHLNLPEGYEIFEGDESHLSSLQIESDYKMQMYKERIKINKIYIVKYADELIGYRWVSLDGKTYPQFDLMEHLPENTIYAYDAYVRPEHRGKRLFSHILHKIMEDHMKEGMRLGSYSDYFNRNAQKAKEKQNEKKECLMIFAKFFDRFDMTTRLKSYR